MSEDLKKLQSALHAARQLCSCAAKLCPSPSLGTNQSVSYNFAKGKWKKKAVTYMSTVFYYEDDKIYIEAEPPDYDFSSPSWTIEKIAIVRRKLLIRQHEIVYEAKNHNIPRSTGISRMGLWVDYVIQLGQWAENILKDEKDKAKQRKLTLKQEQNRQQEVNQHPIDDADIFG